MDSAKKWILSFFAIEAAGLAVFAAAAFLIDPFFQFRVRDNTYTLQEWFVSSGLIENYRYDTLLIGSSMTRNFDMDLIRKELGAEPLHIGLGGIRPAEIGELVGLAYDSGHAGRYYICVDLGFFGNPSEESRLPRYLLKRDLLSHLRYLLSYEVWFRYIPADLGLLLCDRLGVKLPEKISYSRSIDRLGDWEYRYNYRGKEEVIGRYQKRIGRVPALEAAGLYERMTAHIDLYFSRFHFENGEHVFFFPPIPASSGATRSAPAILRSTFGQRNISSGPPFGAERQSLTSSPPKLPPTLTTTATSSTTARKSPI